MNYLQNYSGGLSGDGQGRGGFSGGWYSDVWYDGGRFFPVVAAGSYWWVVVVGAAQLQQPSSWSAVAGIADLLRRLVAVAAQ